MSKKVVVVSRSLRKNSNSRRLAEQFAKGAQRRGNTVEFVDLADKKIGFCTGCMGCAEKAKCVIKDDAAELMDTVRNADVLAFATPIYYYSVSGRMKTFLDRMNPIYFAGHSFKDVYFMASAATGDEGEFDTAVNDLQGWIVCFAGAQLAGTVRAAGANRPGEISQYPDKLQQAYDMGKNV